MAGNRKKRQEDFSQAFEERVIFINRVSKVVKGGKNLGFSAIVAVGDKAGKIGIGLGKAREVSDAIRKGNEAARRNMKIYSLSDNGRTIPHPVKAKFRSTNVIIKPAAPGTGVIAGSVVRAILEALGVQDAITKVLGSRTAVNVAYATIKALDDLEDLSGVSLRRGIPVAKLKSTK
ncbi:30S ribosomal protein S5 [bacterium]|nr:MAG: 30S ribosomal protein S5 [bacterium]